MSRFDALLREAERTPIGGWDFGRLGGRIGIDPPPWDFKQIVEDHVAAATDLLDMGTGGGEWLASLSARPPRTVATESWAPNIDVAGARLRPLGVTVVVVESAPESVAQRAGEKRGRLPFPTGSFELITNRHETFAAAEVARVLTPGGVFLTQQTGGNYDEFYGALGLEPPARGEAQWDLALAREQLAAPGLRTVESGEGFEATTFADAGALAWYLLTAPWTVEGFTIEAHRGHLERVHHRIAQEGPITLRLPSFWLKAVKLK